jgi:hypothetical protein
MPSTQSYLPPKLSQKASWFQNFANLITVNFAAYGLTSGQATTFGTLNSTFQNAYLAATAPSTRTKATVATQNSALSAVTTSARSLANIIQANPTVTNTQRQQLNLTVRNTSPTPIGAPTTKPIVTLLNTTSQRVNFRFADELTPASNAKPFGAIGLRVYTKLGAVAPASIAECDFAGTFTKNSSGPGSAQCFVQFDGSAAGQKAWFLAVWQNRRGEIGPESTSTSMIVA